MNSVSVSLFALLAVLACASAIPHSRMTDAEITDCQKACPDIYLPVCGYNNMEYKRFDNDCNMDVVNCIQQVRHSEVFVETSMNMCEEQTKINKEEPDCNKACTMEYNPVCGFDGREAKTYGNMCMFETANCESNYKLRIARIGECQEVDQIPPVKEIKAKCIRPCPASYIPVCGFDGENYHTYGNTCEFEMMNCDSENHLRMIKMGECPEEKENNEVNPVKNDCNKPCTMEYYPICGFNGREIKTYGNMCIFENANCESDYKLRITRYGECPKVDKIPPVKEIKPECIRPCPASYIPVCGFDGENYHTYGNTCEFEMMNCDSENHLRMVRNGEC